MFVSSGLEGTSGDPLYEGGDKDVLMTEMEADSDKDRSVDNLVFVDTPPEKKWGMRLQSWSRRLMTLL